MDLLIKNAVINNLTTDVLISDGRIIKIAQNINVPSKTLIDAAGKYIVPSLKNGHTHSGMTLLRG